MCTLNEFFCCRQEIDTDSIISITNVGSCYLPLPFASALLNKGEKAYTVYCDRLTTPDRHSARALVPTKGNPAVDVARTVEGLRDVITNCSMSGYITELRGSMADQHDSVQATMKMLPVLAAVCVIIVLGVLLFAFRAIFLSVRAVVTVSLTLTCVYGVATIIFCTTILDGLFPELSYFLSFFVLS